MFWMWLRYLPLPKYFFTDDDKDDGDDILPTIIVYNNLSPMLIEYFDSNVPSFSNSKLSSIYSTILTKINSMVDIAILFNVLTIKTKNHMIQIIHESKLLLPGFLALFLPSFITQYACIYIKTILPCINTHPKDNESINRWLKYFITVVIFDTFVLYWIPLFKVHMSLIIYLYLNLSLERICIGSCFVYRYIEYELVCFGLLPKDEDDDLRISDTITVRSLSWCISKLPSSVGEEDDI